ncbi:MAG: alpha/beta fold hydrolase [Verrucomicrobiota bacterium]
MNSSLTTALIVAFQTMGFSFASKASTSTECVVLVHGLGRTSMSMKRLEWNLARAGYQTVNVSYPSRDRSVEQLAEVYLQDVVARKMVSAATKVHFVTHSMGGIILR